MAEQNVTGASGRFLKDGTVDSRKFKSSNLRYVKDTFQNQPFGTENDGTVASGATGAVNMLSTGSALFEQHIKGAGQTIIVPILEAAGLDIALDKTNDEGAEYTLGITDRSKGAFLIPSLTVGVPAGDKPFFAEVIFNIADVSGTDDCAFGFRKCEAYQAAIDNYDEGAFLNVIGGDVKVETILNNAATVTTDTLFNWADGETHRLRVEVIGRSVKFFINGVATGETVRFDGLGASITAQPTAGVPAFSFDAGEKVCVFFYYLHDATSPGKVLLKSWESGFLPEPTVN